MSRLNPPASLLARGAFASFVPSGFPFTGFVVATKSLLADVDRLLRRRLGCFSEPLEDHHGIPVDPMDDAPNPTSILNPQLVTPRADHRHRPRMRERQGFPSL